MAYKFTYLARAFSNQVKSGPIPAAVFFLENLKIQKFSVLN